MNRAALRLATVAALTNGGAAPWPTMAGPRVYDSRADALDLSKPDEPMPVIVLHTERDRQQRSLNGGRAANYVVRRFVDLRLDIGLTTFGMDDEGQPIAEWAKIDADLEAMLDLFEYQIEAALFGSSPWALWWRGLFGVTETVSERFVADPDDGALRFAAREIFYTVDVKPDCLPTAVLADDPAPQPELLGNMVAVASFIASQGSGALKDNAARVVSILTAQSLPESPVYPNLQSLVATIPEAAPPEGETPEIDVEFIALGPLPQQE